jgi:transposase
MQAKRRFGLPETAPVVSCAAAGRQGFWLQRFLHAQGMTNQVVDSSAMAVNGAKSSVHYPRQERLASFW